MYSKKELTSFTTRLKKVTKEYPKSIQHIADTVDSLKETPTQGDAYPGFGELSVRKMRIGLPYLLHLLNHGTGLPLPPCSTTWTVRF